MSKHVKSKTPQSVGQLARMSVTQSSITLPLTSSWLLRVSDHALSPSDSWPENEGK